MNLILDMDGTLINERMEPRPHLKEFFEYVFSHFSNVSIWTFANTHWFALVYHTVFVHLLPKGKTFHFVWCRVNCKLVEYVPNIPMVVKPLVEIYKRYPIVYNPYNTLILDDTPSTYRENVGNAIRISTYSVNKTDTELLNIMYEFERKLFSPIKRHLL